MILKNDPEWDERWSQLNGLAMRFETAVVPFPAQGYLDEFYEFYEIRNRKPVLIPSEEAFRDALREVSGDDVWEPIAKKTEEFFGLPERVMVFGDDTELREELGGLDGLSPFFFVFGIMFCEYEDFTLCFMSGSNN